MQNSEDTSHAQNTEFEMPSETKVQNSQERKTNQNNEPATIDNNVSVLNGVAVNDNASYLDYQDGNRMTLFHKSSHNVINVNLNYTKEEQVSLFFRPTEEVVNLTFYKDAQNRRPIVTSDDSNLEPKLDECQTLDSVSDVRWRPVKVNTDTLAQDYMKLAKIRLTGKGLSTHGIANTFMLSQFLNCLL